MTKATRDALVQVDRILHDAGWDEDDQPAGPVEELTEMTHQLESLSSTPYWGELCKTIREYYRKASRNSGAMSSPRSKN